MTNRRSGLLALLAGVVLLPAPLYWDALHRLGVIAPILDPGAAIGAVPDGVYPSAVGAAAIGVGGALLVLDAVDEKPAVVVLAGAAFGALLGVLTPLLVARISPTGAMQVGLAGAAPGFAAVAGIGTDKPARRWGKGLVVLFFVPFAGSQLLRGLSVGGLAGFASLVLVLALLVYTGILSYVFYRLGRSASPESA